MIKNGEGFPLLRFFEFLDGALFVYPEAVQFACLFVRSWWILIAAQGKNFRRRK
jgi:hypothetical protein